MQQPVNTVLYYVYKQYISRVASAGYYVILIRLLTMENHVLNDHKPAF